VIAKAKRLPCASHGSREKLCQGSWIEVLYYKQCAAPFGSAKKHRAKYISLNFDDKMQKRAAVNFSIAPLFFIIYWFHKRLPATY